MRKHLSLNIEAEVYHEIKSTFPAGQVSTFVNDILKEYLKKLKKEQERELEIASKIKKNRPSLIVSNDAQNEFDEEIIAVPSSRQELKRIRSYEIFIKHNKENGLDEDSKFLFNRLRNIEKATRL